MFSSDFILLHSLCMVRQNNRGPMGFPCWTPSYDNTNLSPHTRKDGKEYVEWIKGKMLGINSSTNNILSFLNAIEGIF